MTGDEYSGVVRGLAVSDLNGVYVTDMPNCCVKASAVHGYPPPGNDHTPPVTTVSN